MALSESASTTESVMVPGELKLSNPVPPPITVPLPIVAWPHEVKNFWFGLLLLAAGDTSAGWRVLWPRLVRCIWSIMVR